MAKISPEDKLDTVASERLDMIVKALDEIGFEAAKEQYEGKPSIISKNCIIYETAMENYDLICCAFHGKLIEKALPGMKVELKSCMAE